MIFDFSMAHLGDVLMALPAMRWGDAVIAKPEHRVPGAPVKWLDKGVATVHPAPRRGRHTTDAWLEATERAPVRHELMPAAPKKLYVIAPEVESPSKYWKAWVDLDTNEDVILSSTMEREEWMDTLNQAHTVICPDTGTAHMADALGCPRVIALHGIPANWPHCAPYWDRRYCIARDSMDAITVDDVMEMVRA